MEGVIPVGDTELREHTGAENRRVSAARLAAIGVSGGDRNAAAALAVDERLIAFCEQERVTRIRRAGLRSGELPLEALDTVLQIAGTTTDAITAFVTAEDGISI